MSTPDLTSASLSDLTSLAGRKAAVTGGAMGIGEAIARRMAEAGADVAVGDLDEGRAKEVADRLAGESGVSAFGMHLDVADERSVEEFAGRVVEELGGLDIWVNNAGIYPSVPFLEMSTGDWDRVLNVNLRGTFLGSRVAARRMVEQGRGGAIVNITSTAGFRAAGPGVAHYVSSKHAVGGLTKSLAVELGPHGIRVLAVAPTLIETPGIDANRAAFEEAGLGDVIAGFADRLPLGRVGVPDDVARIVLFAAGDLAAFMTGSTLAADAGDLAL